MSDPQITHVLAKFQLKLAGSDVSFFFFAEHLDLFETLYDKRDPPHQRF